MTGPRDGWDGAGDADQRLAAAAALEADGAYRVLKRIDPPAAESDLPAWAGAGRVVGVADIETSGLGRSCRIIELAIRRLRVDPEGVIREVGRPYSFLEDPGEALDPAIVRLTGLSDADLAGRVIDERMAVSLFRSCEVVAFHNACFDVPRLLDRLPLAGQPFACTMREVDWRARGIRGGANLACLLCQTGWFAAQAHRAMADVDATIRLLGHRDGDGRTAMAELLETAARPTLRFSAAGAAFGEPKDSLKARGYRWDAECRTWSREVAVDARDGEAAWLAENVYAARWNPKSDGPIVETVDWRSRHG